MNVIENYDKIMSNIDRACQRSGRKPGDVKVLGVVKDQPIERINAAYHCGIRMIGENKTQEAETHREALKQLDIDWHFIGKLQKNKINRILKEFDFIQSVDGVKALEHIQKRVNDPIEVFIEINIGEEKSKSGFTLDGLMKAMNYISMLNRVRITGLMAVPPFAENPEDTRHYFAKIRELGERINEMNVANFEILHLSMGMSADYEIAIEEGATIVRIGSALFGRRGR